MKETGRAIASGLLLGSSGLFAYQLIRGLRTKDRAPERARQTAIEKVVTAGITAVAVYIAVDWNFRVISSLIETGSVPEDFWNP